MINTRKFTGGHKVPHLAEHAIGSYQFLDKDGAVFIPTKCSIKVYQDTEFDGKILCPLTLILKLCEQGWPGL